MSSPATDHLVGSVLDGRYRVLSHIADGGMASVYVAVDERLDREVALKVMKPSLATDPVFVDRFRREARSAAQLSHPGVVAVFDQGDDGEHVFLAMELVNGQTLREVMHAEGPLTPRAALDFLDQILQALGAAHAAGLVHRDVKPENVILRTDGAVKVADFGLARAAAPSAATAQTGVLLGTVAYLAPEQVEKGVADARSDVYAAGLLLFEMLTGTKAFTGDTAIQVAYQHVHGVVPIPSDRVPTVPAELDRLVSLATSRNPEDRPRDATAFLRELRRARAGLSPEQLDRRPAGSSGSADGHDGGAPPPPVPTVAVGATEVVTATSRTTAMPRPGMPPVGSAAPAGSATQVVPVPGRAAAPVTTGSPAGAAASRSPLAGFEGGRAAGAGGGGATRSEGPRAGRRTGPIAALVLLLLAAVVAGWYFLGGPGASTTVPRVIGQTQAAATSRLSAAHLSATVVRAYSESVKSGVVVSSDPTAGTSLSRSSPVQLTVSRGPERHTVPTLKGLSLAEATQQLADAHLVVGTNTSAYSDKVTQGQIISSDPKAGTSLKRGAAVNVVVSKGRQPITLADWTGKSVTDAATALNAQGLTVDSSQQQFSTTIAKGSVISQDPAAGATLFKGDKVTLVGSKGPQNMPVPDVTLKRVGEATKILKAAGFKVQVNNVIGAAIVGRVTSQFPSGGTVAPAGSVVTLTVI